MLKKIKKQASPVKKDEVKGEEAKKSLLQELFNTDDERAIAEIILKTGDIQVTESYRKGKVEQKKNTATARFELRFPEPKSGVFNR